MASKNTNDRNNTAAKDPAEWVTGDEPMTGPQESYVNTLAHEAGERVDDEMTKAEASEKIEELQARTGRGAPARQSRGKKSTNRKGG
ncbi:MAG TPA: DUF3072 domain-containing protein [Gemmataceae bacterium]|nr:DUF3072 domain-containing protein [Gemmataceae bacterium]